MKKLFLPLLGVLGFLAFWRKDDDGEVAPTKPSEGSASDSPIHVMGDSYAVGVAAALKKLYPGRKISVDAAVGRPASAMKPYNTGDSDMVLIVSAGTNDLAGSASIDSIVEKVWSLIRGGPIGVGEPNIIYLMPSRQVGNKKLAERITLFEAELVGTYLKTWSVDYVKLPPPNAPDGLHYQPHTYGEIGTQAINLADVGMEVASYG